MTVDVVILGLGYVGLPIAREATLAGLSVIGFDVNAPLVEALNAGRSHVDDLSDHDIAQMIDDGFSATDDEHAIATAKTAVICVPTPLSEEGGPDLGAVRSATECVARNLRSGMLVILESTTYPGHHRRVGHVPSWKASGPYRRSGLPSRILAQSASIPAIRSSVPGNTPKVVGGHPRMYRSSGAAFYGRFDQHYSCARRALGRLRPAKLLENTYRHVNIALVNEMAKFCHRLGIDLWDVNPRSVEQAVRFQAFLSRARRRWALHPDRSELPEPQRAGKTWVPVPIC